MSEPIDKHHAAIKAAHPVRTGNHARYARAQEMVSARHAKGDLIELVNWLLMRAEESECRANDAYALTRRYR